MIQLVWALRAILCVFDYVLLIIILDAILTHWLKSLYIHIKRRLYLASLKKGKCLEFVFTLLSNLVFYFVAY